MNTYQKRYVALEIFYLGAAYHGFASQADTELTVEVSAKSITKMCHILCKPILQAIPVKAASHEVSACEGECAPPAICLSSAMHLLPS